MDALPFPVQRRLQLSGRLTGQAHHSRFQVLHSGGVRTVYAGTGRQGRELGG